MYLVVSVWDIIDKVFKKIGQPIMTVKELLASLDDSVWKLFEDGITCTLNQVGEDWATAIIRKYKPRSMEELAMFVAAIRPNFAPQRDDFIARKPYTTGSYDLDEVLKATDHRVLFQENLMQYFEWLGVTPAESIGLIKKISKKKIKPDDFKNLEDRIRKKWVENTGSEDGFDKTWSDMQAQMSYGFNCVSGDTKFSRMKNGEYAPTVEEMYLIMNDGQYAKEHGYKYLHEKYLYSGYGKAFSMFDDGRIRPNNIIDIHPAGIRPTFKVRTASGAEIVCTSNHGFPTPKGKLPLEKLSVGDELYINGEMGLVTNKIVSIEPQGLKQVYDIEMADPAHNFVVESGIVTSNSPHGEATALDCLYCAYLKAKYPIEYYSVVLNIYKDDVDKTSKLIDELKYFGIKLEPGVFRHSNMDYTFEKDTNTIYKGLASLKFISEDCCTSLYDMRMLQFDDFISLLVYIKENTTINIRQLRVLTSINFFREFGKNKKLLSILEKFDERYSKQHTDKTKARRIQEIRDYEESLDDEALPLGEQIALEMDYIGYISVRMDISKRYTYVADIDTKFTPRVSLYCLNTGKTIDAKVDKKKFAKNKFKQGDVIYCKKFEKRENWSKTDNGFVRNGTYSDVLTDWEVTECLE